MTWRDGVIPIPVEAIFCDIELSDFFVGDLHPCGIDVVVNFSFHAQALRGLGGPNEIDDDFVADQRLAAPVHADKGKHAMLDLVPFAGRRRKMTYSNRKPEFFGEFLEFNFPKPDTGTVAAAAVGHDL